MPIIDTVESNLRQYAAANSASLLFVHFDKNIYSNFENVWLRAYLLNSDASVDSINTLEVFLVKDNDRRIWAESRFVMKKGFAAGNMFLPDSLPPGNFSFIAYTNRVFNGTPDDIFVQPVTVKTAEGDFSLSLVLLDTITAGKDSLKVLVRASGKSLKDLKDAKFSYSLGNGQPRAGAMGKTGETEINIPAGELQGANSILHAELKNGLLYKNSSLTLPTKSCAGQVKFFPEGGNLVDSTPAVVGWEVKNSQGAPLQVTGLLIENGQVTDTINTGPDGIGKFVITPRSISRYTVMIHDARLVDTSYQLPRIFPLMPSFAVANAVADDTLYVTVRNIHTGVGNLYFVLYDFRSLFKAYGLRAAQAVQSLSIPLAELPKGAFTLTLMNEEGRPYAERLCFAHYNTRDTVVISTDSSYYLARQKVQLKISLKGHFSEPAGAILSVACVQAARMDFSKIMDIASYTYLGHSMANIPVAPGLLGGSDNGRKLETILLVRGWRRYTWADMMHSTANPPHILQDNMLFQGQVTRNNKTIKNPVDIGLYTDNSVQTITTGSDGRFQIPAEGLVTNPDKKVLFFINKGFQMSYSLHLADPYHNINLRLASQLQFHNFDISGQDNNNASFALKPGEYQNILQAVTVSAAANGTSISGHYPVYKGACTDYVCPYGYLNCGDHKFNPANTKPVNGHVYIATEQGKTGLMVYSGNCGGEDTKNDYLVTLDGTYTNKEFYASDFSNTVATASPEYLSTLYWNPTVLITGRETAVLSFYTGDLPGRFKIVVQGRTDNDVVYGEYFFTVKSR